MNLLIHFVFRVRVSVRVTRKKKLFESENRSDCRTCSRMFCFSLFRQTSDLNDSLSLLLPKLLEFFFLALLVEHNLISFFEHFSSTVCRTVKSNCFQLAHASSSHNCQLKESD